MSKQRAAVIYGLHSVRHALAQSPAYVLELYIQKRRKPSPELKQILAMAEAAGISRQHVSRDYLDKCTANALHQGVLIKTSPDKLKRSADLDSLLAEHDGALLLLVLEGIQDPHNLGACLRTANAAGVDAVLFSTDRAAGINPTVSKVASGGAENTALIPVGNIARTLRKLQAAGVWVVGTDNTADKSLYAVDLSVPVAIVMGSEGRGLRHNTREHCDHLVNLPMRGVVESLNVSVATGICLYEVLRQRHAGSISGQ